MSSHRNDQHHYQHTESYADRRRRHCHNHHQSGLAGGTIVSTEADDMLVGTRVVDMVFGVASEDIVFSQF